MKHLVPLLSFSQKSFKSDDDDNVDGSASGSGIDSGSGSGSVQEAILADGWLADLATGDSTRIRNLSATAQTLVTLMIVCLVSLVVHL